MANEANTLGTQKTIREYLSDTLRDSTSETTGTGLKIFLEGESVQVYGIDLLWNGQEYLISYKTGTLEEDPAPTGQTDKPGTYTLKLSQYPTIEQLSLVLPLTFVTTPKISKVEVDPES